MAQDSFAGWRLNAQGVLAGASLRGTPAWAVFEASLIEALDPADRAHSVHRPVIAADGRRVLSEGDRLVPAGELRRLPDGSLQGRPRRYPPSSMAVVFKDRRTGRLVGLSHDSAADSLAARGDMLEASGIPLGLGRLRSYTPERAPRVDELVGRLGVDAARLLVNPRTRCEMSPEELSLTRRASAIIREDLARSRGPSRPREGAVLGRVSPPEGGVSGSDRPLPAS